jgi:5-methylcytosine-specific restriction endonuclease McrA
MRKNYIEEIYRTRICHWCRKHLKDGDKIYTPFNVNLFLCEDDKDNLINPPDFDPQGSKEKGTTSWKTAKILTLIRDDCHCRVCGDSYHREHPVEVHHIIPRKDGGTHNLKNLVTLCEKHHKETFQNNYAGLKLTDRFIQIGVQRRLSDVTES